MISPAKIGIKVIEIVWKNAIQAYADPVLFYKIPLIFEGTERPTAGKLIE